MTNTPNTVTITIDECEHRALCLIDVNRCGATSLRETYDVDAALELRAAALAISSDNAYPLPVQIGADSIVTQIDTGLDG